MCLPLPAAYRSLPRPSSPRDAKASVVRPYTLGRRSKPSSISLRCNSSSQKTVQLSKIDPAGAGKSELRRETWPQGLVGVPGVEPGTSSLSGTRSNQLSYTPATPETAPPRWWRQPGSNRRHPACKAGALPTELCPRNGTSLSTRAQALVSDRPRGPEGMRKSLMPCRQD